MEQNTERGWSPSPLLAGFYIFLSGWYLQPLLAGVVGVLFAVVLYPFLADEIVLWLLTYLALPLSTLPASGLIILSSEYLRGRVHRGLYVVRYLQPSLLTGYVWWLFLGDSARSLLGAGVVALSGYLPVIVIARRRSGRERPGGSG